MDGISFEAKRGQIHGVVGANGTGKTTFFKILLGLIPADHGRVEMDREHPKPIGGIIEKPSVYEFLNSHENLRLFARMQGIRLGDQTIVNYLERVGLDPQRTDAVANYSMGMKQRLGIAVALLNNPNLLVLDEPFSGLDPVGIEQLKTLILNLVKNEGLTLLVSSHILTHLYEICDQLYLIRERQLEPFELASPAGYTLVADNMQAAVGLLPEGSEVMGNRALVSASPEQLPALLKDLLEAEVLVRACIPAVNAENWTTS